MEEKYPIRYQELPKEELLEDAKKVWKELQTYDISRVRHVLSAIHDDLSKDFVSDEVSKRIQEFLEKNFLLQMLLFAFVSTDSKEVASLITELIHLTIEKASKRPYVLSMISIIIIELTKDETNDKIEIILKKLFGASKRIENIKKQYFIDYAKGGKYESATSFFEELQKPVASSSSDFFLLFAFTLRQTSLQHLPEFLAYYQKNYDEGNYFLFLQSIISEEKDLFKEEQIELVKEWITENKGIQAKRKSPNITDERLIKIKAEKIEPLFDILKAYFADEQHDLLKAALEGKNIDTKLLFNGKSNRLIYVFAELKQKYHLDNLQEEIIKWIENLFVFTDSQGEIVTAAYNTIKNVLTNKNNAPKPPIDLSEL